MKNSSFPLIKIGEQLSYVYQHIPFYKTRFDEHNINPNQIKDYLDFLKIPVLNKSEVRDIIYDLKSYISDEYYYKDNKNEKGQILFGERTSGSTGIPIYCYKTRNERVQGALSAWKVRKWWDKDILGKKAVGIGPIALNTQIHNSDWSLILSPMNISDDMLHEYFKRIVEFQPHWIAGIPSILYKMSLFLENNQEYKKKLKLSFVELEGEYIIPEYKKVIANAFSCRVSNQYGCTELWVLAYSCPQEKLHILEDDVFVEILDDKGMPVQEGEVGIVTVTGLKNKSMGFVRYSLGDKARFVDNCSCGIKWKCLELVGSRTSQVLKLPNGKQYDGSIFYWILIELYHDKPISIYFNNFHIVQKKLNKIVFYFEKGKRFDSIKDEFVKRFSEEIKRRVYSDMIVECCESSFERSSGEKFSYFRSDC